MFVDLVGIVQVCTSMFKLVYTCTTVAEDSKSSGHLVTVDHFLNNDEKITYYYCSFEAGTVLCFYFDFQFVYYSVQESIFLYFLLR